MRTLVWQSPHFVYTLPFHYVIARSVGTWQSVSYSLHFGVQEWKRKRTRKWNLSGEELCEMILLQQMRIATPVTTVTGSQ